MWAPSGRRTVVARSSCLFLAPLQPTTYGALRGSSMFATFLQRHDGFFLSSRGQPSPPRRAIMYKIRAGKAKPPPVEKGGKGQDQSKQDYVKAPPPPSPPPPSPPPPPKGTSTNTSTASADDDAARRQAFPDLYQFLDGLGVEFGLDKETHTTEPQRAGEPARPKTTIAFADDEEGRQQEEERRDHTARPDAPLTEAPQQQQQKLNLSREEMEELTSINDFVRRVHQKDELEDDPLILLFQQIDKEKELLKIQQEHVENMPEYIGFNEEFQAEEERIRKEWKENPRPVSAEHVQELYQKLEEKRVELWEKYTTEAGERLARGFRELAEAALDEEDEEEMEKDNPPRKK